MDTDSQGDLVGKLDISFDEFARKETKGNSSSFADAVTVWVNKPHVVNRRLCGTKILHQQIVPAKLRAEKWVEYIKTIADSDLEKILQEDESHSTNNLIEVPSLSVLQNHECMIILRDLLPKNTQKNPTVREAVLYDASECSVQFHPIVDMTPEEREEPLDSNPSENLHQTNSVTSKFVKSCSKLPCYEMIYRQENEVNVICLNVRKDMKNENAYQTVEWLRDNVLKKICNWSRESKLKTTVTSLRLIPIDQYNDLYGQLKDKYGKHFVEVWPEKTDPLKFVYEDVAIATYLLVLWQKEREEKGLQHKQSFVDLGCGNGLLVHILQSEGHPGLGLDVRKRGIWDLYGDATKLKEETVTPSGDSLFPKYDWIIGNHSDELTPWIPVIAARSSYECSFFVLPCCHFDFNRKFSAAGAAVSSYRAYLNFVKDVGEVCGFNTLEDSLRIPSTKRVCFIGSTRSYSREEEVVADKRRTDYIDNRCSKNLAEQLPSKNSEEQTISQTSQEGDSESSPKRLKLDTTHEQWAKDFQPRANTECSRNCKNVKKEIKDHIVHTVFKKLLDADENETRKLSDGKIWRKGGILPLSVVIELFDKSTLKELKSECGGLQTLLRNHNSVFNVSGGMVQLRDLTLDNPFSKKSKLGKEDKSQYFKTMLCWFYCHHPDGCPRNKDTCTFAHGEEDLQALTKLKNQS